MLYEMPTSSKMKQESNGTLGAYTGINSVLFSDATSLLPFSFAKSKGILNASLCISNPPPYRLQEKVGREVCVCELLITTLIQINIKVLRLIEVLQFC